MSDDIVEIATELSMNKFNYTFTWVDHFSIYAWIIPIRNKKVITVRNAIAHVFINGYPEQLQ